MDIRQVLRKQTVTQRLSLSPLSLLSSKFVGFLREVLVANYFGATGTTDAFLVAMLIPGSILGLFSGGFNTLIIPFYLEKKAQSLDAARRFVNSALTVWGSVFVAISILVLSSLQPASG